MRKKAIISAVRLSPPRLLVLRRPSKWLPLRRAAPRAGAAAGSGRPLNIKRIARSVSWGLHLSVSGTASLLSGEGEQGVGRWSGAGGGCCVPHFALTCLILVCATVVDPFKQHLCHFYIDSYWPVSHAHDIYFI